MTMRFLRASAILLVASSLRQSAAEEATRKPASRSLQQSFNYEVIESGTSLSTTRKSQPVAFAATFTNAWTRERHPFRFPSNNAHWSPMVFASHSDEYTMWCDECIATDGVKLIAETGGTSTLMDEIDTQQGRKAVLDQTTAPGSRQPVRLGDESPADGSLCFDEQHPLASAISMIAPSPDWFSGLYNLRLWKEDADGNDVWYDRFQAYVYAWDAGTEEGDSYSLNNRPTTPREGMLPFMAGNRPDEVFVSGSLSEVRTEEGTCTSREECDQKRLEMGFSQFSTGNYPTKGCFSKNDRAYWSDGTDEELSRLDLPGVQKRIRCDNVVEGGGGDLRVLPVGIVTFELQGTSPECTSISDDASMADSTARFFVRTRMGQDNFISTDCGEWATTSHRCSRNTFSGGRPTGVRVRDLCPASCMAFLV